MIYCPFCKTSNRNGSKFCNECGASLGEEGLVCPECAARNPTLNRFCHACGQALEEAGGQSRESSPPQADETSQFPTLDSRLPTPDSPQELPPRQTIAEPAPPPAALPSWLELAEQEPVEAEPLPFREPPQPAPSLLPLPEWLWLEEPERVLPAWLELSDEPFGQDMIVEVVNQGTFAPRPIRESSSTLDSRPPEADSTLDSGSAPRLPDWLTIVEEPVSGGRSLPDWLSLAEPPMTEPRVERALPSWLLSEEEPELPMRPAAALPSWLFLEEPGEALPVFEQGVAVSLEARPTPGIILARPFELPQPLRRRAAELAPAPDYGAVFSEILQPKTELTSDLAPPIARRHRLVSLLLIVVISLPLLVPLGINVEPKRGASDVFVAAQALPPAANVLVTFDWSPGSDEEMAPIAEVIIRHLVRRKAEIVAVSLTPEGGKLAQRIIDRSVLGMKGYEYGNQVANLGYLPGGEAAIRAMMADLPGSYGVDHFGNSARDLPLLKDVQSLKSADLVVILASEPEMLMRWVAQVSSTHQGTRMVAGVSFAALPWARPFAAAGGADDSPQLKGTVAGIRGAAEYELLSSESRAVVAALDAQSLGSVFLVLVVIFGNLAYLRGNLRGNLGGKKKRSGPARRAQPDSAGS